MYGGGGGLAYHNFLSLLTVCAVGKFSVFNLALDVFINLVCVFDTKI
jgi:hypothetical protein